MNIIDTIRKRSPNTRNIGLILKAFGEELFEKSRVGIYSDNLTNKRLHRVGKQYGTKKQEEPDQGRKLKKPDQEQEKPKKSLDEHARGTSQAALEEAIKSHKDESVRKAAHKELERRKNEEAPKEEKDKAGVKDKELDDLKKEYQQALDSNDFEKIEGISKRLVERSREVNEKVNKERRENKISKRIEDLSDKYKNKMQELTKDENIGNDELQSKLSKESQEISRYIHRVRQFEKLDLKEEIDKCGKLLKLKNEKEVKDFFGDGEVLGIQVLGNFVDVLTDDCYVTRTFNKKEVHMDEFLLNPDVDKSKGIGTQIFNNQIKNFKEKGFKTVKTTAAKSNIYNGYYTWARLGYNINNPVEKKYFKRLMEDSEDKDFKKIESLSELMSTEKGRKFWKENGFQFDGTFDLSDDSESMFILNEYIKDKQNGKEKK